LPVHLPAISRDLIGWQLKSPIPATAIAAALAAAATARVLSSDTPMLVAPTHFRIPLQRE